MSAGSDIYDRPASASNGILPHHQVGLDRNGSDAGSRDSFIQRKSRPRDSHEDCEKLEASNRKMQVVFCFLIVLCFFVLIVYIGTIIYLFVSLPKLTSKSQTSKDGHSGQVAAGESTRFCVPRTEMDEFKKIWDPEDQNDIAKTLDVEYNYRKDSEEPTYCFHSLHWVPKIMGKINTAVEASVRYIEGEQQHISRVVQAYTSEKNDTQRDCATSGGYSHDPTDPAGSVYAHFFLRRRQTPSSEERSYELRWDLEGQGGSSANGVRVNAHSGVFTVQYSGFYYVYSHLVFREATNVVHRVIKNRNKQSGMTLLESLHGPSSLLQGVFMLYVNDTLIINATTNNLATSRSKASYTGLYLIRT